MGGKTLKGLTIKIGGDTTELNKSLEQVKKQGRSLSGELGQINKLLKMDPKNTELLAQKQKVLAEAIGNTEKKLDTLKEAEKQVQAQFERGEVSEAQYRALQREIIATEGKINAYKNAVKETAEVQNDLASGAERSGRELGKAGDTSEKAEKKFDAAGAAVTALTASVVALGAASVDAFNEVDDGADSVIRATGATGASAGKLTAVYKNVATQIVGSFDDIGATVGEVNTRFGYTGKQLEECSVDFMKFAEITGVNSTEAVKSVTRALNDAGIPLDQYKILLDQLSKAGQSAGIDVTKLAEGLSTNGATMRSMGLDTAESIALLAQFELSGADATTMLSGMKKAMATWAKEGKDGNREFAQLVEGVKTGSVSAADALEVFGSKAGPQLVDAIRSGKFEYDSMLTTLRESEGTLESTFGEMEDGGYKVQRSFQRLKVMMSDTGEVIMESAAPALEELLDYLEDKGVVEDFASTLKDDVIPSIVTIGKWFAQNTPVIKAGLTGAAAAMVAFKVASVATTVAQKGLKGAIVSTTVAQKALTLAQSATPWGLVAVGITAVVAATAAYTAATKEAEKPVDNLTEAERELMNQTLETADAFKEQKQATDELLRNTTAEMDYVQGLADELKVLADESGRVLQKDQDRVNFILHELKKATGEEYSMVDGVIQKYDELKASIDEVIASKKANSLLDAYNDQYIQAVNGSSDAFAQMSLAEKDLNAQYQRKEDALKKAEEAQSSYNEVLKKYNKEVEKGSISDDTAKSLATKSRAFTDAWAAYNKEFRTWEEKQTAYDNAAANYRDHFDTIANYEEAQTAVLSGNYEKVVDILSRKGDVYIQFSDTVDRATAEVLSKLQKEAVDAGLAAERARDNFEKGLATEETVQEAERAYADALGEFENAYADAYDFGADMTDGMIDGADSRRPSLIDTARKLVNGFMDTIRKVSDTHSPSRKTIAIFEDIGEGAVVGTKNKTKDLKKAGADQTLALLDTYRSQEVTAQRTLRSVADQQIARQDVGQLTAATANSNVLGQILQAIRDGQVLIMDGDTVVGRTANKMDSRLGQLRALSARGAR